MAGLSDMEELLSRIQNKEIVEYMREALGCYSAGAYRACIVLSYIAVFDDLRQKLFQLASISSVAKQISKEVEQRASDQQIYEAYMIDQLKVAGLITEGEAFRLDQIRILRNKAAHPSGLHPSPEQARYVYFEAIDKFLSQQVLKTTHEVDGILARLKNDNYFPSRTIDDLAALVSSELAAIHPLGFPYLVNTLVESVDSTDPILAKNAHRFLYGLAANDNSSINQELRNRLLVSKADDSNKRAVLMTILVVNPILLVGLDSTTFLRLRKIMDMAAESEKLQPVGTFGHPANLLLKIVDKLGVEYVETNLSAFSETTTTNFCYSVPVVQAAKKSPALRTLLVSVWKKHAGSSNFDTANTFADTSGQIDSLLTILEPEEAFDTILQVCQAAQWNAFSAINLRNQKFASTPTLVDLAKKYVKDNPTPANEKALQMFSISADEFVEKYLQPAGANN